MASSVIRKEIWYGVGSYTDTSSSSTFQFPAQNRRGYLLLGQSTPISLLVISAMNAEAKNPITGENYTVTANGDYNFTVNAFSWYVNPRAIGIP